MPQGPFAPNGKKSRWIGGGLHAYRGARPAPMGLRDPFVLMNGKGGGMMHADSIFPPAGNGSG
ncbi:MAG: hypothetical protein R3B47_10020 [Bacteroidia bacterium]